MNWFGKFLKRSGQIFGLPGFIISLMVLVGMALAGCSPAKPNLITIGVVNGTPVLDPILQDFKASMVELGYIEGENVEYVYEGPPAKIEDLDGVVARVLEHDVNLILSLSTPATQAAKRGTEGMNIPVVFAPVTDPVAAGIVESWEQPGGNITGVSTGLSEGRRLEWLIDVDPIIKRIYVPHNPDDGSSKVALSFVKDAAEKLGVELVIHEVHSPEDVQAAIHNIPADVDAFFMLPDSLVTAAVEDIIQLSIEKHLPMSPAGASDVKAGGLISLNHPAIARQAAGLADLILQGVAPKDLPIETAEFALVLNLQTAQAIGLVIPDSILRQTDEIIR
jgi:putative ABC transport system substrate-binding protein